MPIHTTINAQRSLLLARAEHSLSCADILLHLHTKSEGGLFGHSELFDARDVTLNVAKDDLLTIAAAMKNEMGAVSPGKIAILTNDATIYDLACRYTAMTKSVHPRVEVFWDDDEARTWLLGPGEEG